MHDTSLRDHLTTAALLPDYVLGKLDETSLRRVARHLEVCPICRRESANAMDVLGVLADVPPPPAWLRGAVVRRAAAENPAAERLRMAPASTIAQLDIRRRLDQPLVLLRDGRRHSFGRQIPRWALAAASVAIFLTIGLAGWSYELRQALSPDERISALVNDPALAYPLDDSDLPVSAAGVVFAEQGGREVYLVANGLPVLPQDQRYQVWLFTTGNTQESAGLLTGGADGDLHALLQTPGPFAGYVGIGLTAEPHAGSAVPTSDLVLGGSFPPVSAMLRSSAS